MRRGLLIVAGAVTLMVVALATIPQDDTPEQTSACLACGLVITERARRPCPRCGSLNRAVAVHAADSVHSEDQAA